MQAHVCLVFALTLVVVVATPGPGILAIVSCAIGRGFREAFAMICGMIIGDLIYFTLAILGMAALAHSMGDLFLVVKFAGAAYLIWLGYKLWRAKVELPVDGVVSPARRGFRRSAAAGLTVTLGNPKAIAFYAGLLPTVVNLDQLSAGNALVMGLIVVFVVGGITTMYALAASRTRRFFRSQRRVKVLNRAAGTMMISAGVVVAAR
jgi:threonine/homoserine/homoserine lactone efflux protein